MPRNLGATKLEPGLEKSMRELWMLLQSPIALIGLGGAIGCNLRYAMGRYLASVFEAHPNFGNLPLSTFVVNVVGSALLGCVAGAISNREHSIYLFLAVGVCGGFTTFSTFSLEVVELLQNNRLALAFGYIFASNLITFLAFSGSNQLSHWLS